MYKLITWIFVLNFSINLSGQNILQKYIYGEDPIHRAEATILVLKNEVLIVRLPAEMQKAEKLYALANSTTLNAKEKEKYKEKHTAHVKSRKAKNEAWIRAFKEHYSYSKVLFILDSDYKSFLDGQHQGLFLDETGEVDNQLSLQNDLFFTCAFGRPQNDGVARESDGLYFLDSAGKELGKPFPYYFDFVTGTPFLGSITNFFDALFSTKDPVKKETEIAQQVTKKMNRRLIKYYEKVIASTSLRAE